MAVVANMFESFKHSSLLETIEGNLHNVIVCLFLYFLHMVVNHVPWLYLLHRVDPELYEHLLLCLKVVALNKAVQDLSL